jgi:non-specific protein-tyrosine kinase
VTELITLKEPTSSAAEAYRVLRTNIQFAALNNPIRTLIVTSAANEDGKSYTLANLAVTMAQSGHRTLIVDADLRRPSQHTLWKLPNDRGLTSLLLNTHQGLPIHSTSVPNLTVMTSGPLPPNPADLLGSKRLTEINALWAELADYVLFDCPPVLATADTPLLATRMDAVLMVIKAGATRRDHAQRAAEALSRANARVIGAALTNAPRDASINTYAQRKSP